MAELPFERLDVYRVALEFAVECHSICATLDRGLGHVANQLRRSSCSVLTNTAEAATEFSPDEKARIFRIALRSAGESLALVAFLERVGALTQTRTGSVRGLGIRAIAMLTNMAKGKGKGRERER
ncbi:MAG: four helix bundle protein [Longimicrobiales bacterium]